MHSYPAGSFATEGAAKWLHYTEVGGETAHNVALQMEGYAVSGLSKRIKQTQHGARWFLIL
jgi:hypothetical protein